MVERIKRWIPVLDHAISEYHSQSQPLGDKLSGGFLATLSLLERMIRSLDSYLTTAAPSISPLPRAASSSTDSAGSASATSEIRSAATGEPESKTGTGTETVATPSIAPGETGDGDATREPPNSVEG